jgi:hypothetical protein
MATVVWIAMLMPLACMAGLLVAAMFGEID